MTRLATLHRATTAIALVLTTALSAVSVSLMPDLPEGPALYPAIADAGTAMTVSAMAFLWSQLPFAVGMVGVAHALRHRHRVLAPVIAALAVLGAFGHTVFGGIGLVRLAMADDLAHADAYAQTIERTMALAIPFSALGLLGTVLSTVLLAVAVLRGALGPRWVGATLLCFVLVEFVGTALTVWATPASVTLLAISFLTLAVAVVTTPVRRWMTAEEAAATRSHDPVPVGN